MLLGLFACGTAACEPDEPSVLLVVQASQDQPSRDDLGVILAIQSRGGHWLELEVSGGTFADGSVGLCQRAPNRSPLSSNVSNVLIYPKLTQAVVSVSLLPDGPLFLDGEAGSAGASESRISEHVGPCGLAVEPLAQVIKPVQRVNVAPAASTGGASGSAGNASGGVAGTAGAEPSGGTNDGGTGGLGGALPEGGSANEAGEGGLGGVAGAGEQI
jgi:hypothetical protein